MFTSANYGFLHYLFSATMGVFQNSACWHIDGTIGGATMGPEEAATATSGVERRGAPPSRHAFSPGDKMGEDEGGREARIGVGGDHGGGGMGSGPGRAEG